MQLENSCMKSAKEAEPVISHRTRLRFSHSRARPSRAAASADPEATISPAAPLFSRWSSAGEIPRGRESRSSLYVRIS